MLYRVCIYEGWVWLERIDWIGWNQAFSHSINRSVSIPKLHHVGHDREVRSDCVVWTSNQSRSVRLSDSQDQVVVERGRHLPDHGPCISLFFPKKDSLEWFGSHRIQSDSIRKWFSMDLNPVPSCPWRSRISLQSSIVPLYGYAPRREELLDFISQMYSSQSVEYWGIDEAFS